MKNLYKAGLFLTIIFIAFSSVSHSQSSKAKKYIVNPSGSPILIDKDGNYLGNFNKNPYDPNSVSNPFGQYGNPYSSESINNQFGRYGNPYSSESVTNPYGSNDSPKLFGSDGNYLGRVNRNQYDPESVSNPFGEYGNPYSPNSINNPYGKYGSPYSPNSVTNPYGSGIEYYQNNQDMFEKNGYYFYDGNLYREDDE